MAKQNSKKVVIVTEKPALELLRNMQVGEHHKFHARRYQSLKTMCSERGFMWGRKYSTALNRDKGTFEVIRNA